MWRFTTGMLVLILAAFTGFLFAGKHYILAVCAVLLCGYLYIRLDQDVT